MSDYFDRLTADMNALGFDPGNDKPQTYQQLYNRLIGLSRYLQDTMAPATLPDPVNLATSVGQKTVKAYDAGLEFDTFNYPCCARSETKLLENLAMEDDYLNAPLIVINNGVPIAVWKAAGDPTYYGLTDDYEHGIVATAFSIPTSFDMFEPKDLPSSETAWTIDSEQISGILPGRFSMFAVPLNARAHLDRPDGRVRSEVFKTSHSHIQARVADLLKTARPAEAYLDSAALFSFS